MRRREPLSWREQLKANDEAFVRTGHLFGLERLTRKESDPGTCEAVWHILSNLCDAAWSVGCKVSPSPIAARSGTSLRNSSSGDRPRGARSDRWIRPRRLMAT